MQMIVFCVSVLIKVLDDGWIIVKEVECKNAWIVEKRSSGG